MPSCPDLVLLQPTASAEVRAVVHAALLGSIPVLRVQAGAIADHARALSSRSALPVGSVEYLAEAMRVAGIRAPEPVSYPPALSWMLRRVVSRHPVGALRAAWAARGPAFVKPVQTKLFTGFVVDPGRVDADYSEHDREQLRALASLPEHCEVWVSEPVAWLSEWRYYVLDGTILGVARYDPEGADDAPAPDAEVVRQAVQAMAATDGGGLRSFGLDIGVLADGRTALVECNDAWALGLYGRSVEPRQYLQMLWARWQQLHAAAAGPCHGLN